MDSWSDYYRLCGDWEPWPNVYAGWICDFVEMLSNCYYGYSHSAWFASDMMLGRIER